MPKRSIGIDIGRSHVRAAQIVRTAEGVRLEKAFTTQTRRSTDSLPEILRSLREEHGFDPRAEVVVSLSHQAFCFADVQTDAAGMGRLRAGDATGLRDCFPIPSDDVVAQVCSVSPAPDGRIALLVAAASQELLGEQLRLLSEGGVRPARIDMPITAAGTAVAFNHPEAGKGLAVLLYVDESVLSITVTQDGTILLARNMPTFSAEGQEPDSLAAQTAEVVAQEIEITWKRLFGTDPDADLRIFLIASGRMIESLVPVLGEKMACRIVPVDPLATIAHDEAVEVDAQLCVAEGLALRTLLPEPAPPVDFLAAYRALTRPRVRTRKELAVCAALAGAVAVVWVIGLFLQRSALESQYAHLKQQEETIFRKAVPEEPVLVNPAAQLRQKLDTLRKDCEIFTGLGPGRPAPLEILDTLSRQRPGRGDLRLNDVLINADSIRIMGSCDSFETFSEWQRLLENTPGLHLTETPQPKKEGGSDRVQFVVSLSTIPRKTS